MSERKAFSIDVGGLKSRPKQSDAGTIAKTDKAGEKHGFIDREPKAKRGRKPSPRTGQVHAKVLPLIQEQIAAEARRRGTQQGVIIEDAWELYCKQHGIIDDN